MKLSEAIEALLSENPYGWSPRTIGFYRGDLGQLMAFLGDVDLNNVGLSDILAWRKFMGYTDRSWHRKVKPVRALYRWLLQRNEIESSPVEHYMPPVPDDRQVEALTDERLQALMEFEPREQWEHRALVVALLCLDGLQVDRIVELTVNDVSLALGIVATREEIMPLSNATVEAIGRWLVIRPQKGGEVALVTNSRGLACSSSGLLVVDVKSLGKLVLGEEITPRHLHATFMKRLVGESVDLRRLQELTGRDVRRLYSVRKKWGMYEDARKRK